MIKVVLLALITALVSLPAIAKTTLVVKPERTIALVGAIEYNAVQAADKIDKLSRASKAPIYLVLSSPGGSVMAGMVTISAMRVAKSRGVRLVCVSTVWAASMAFQIFAECDTRYALANTFLLWHPMWSIVLGNSEDFQHTAEQMKMWEERLNADLIKALNIPATTFYYHYRNETMWTAADLKLLTPNFMTIVDDVNGVIGLFEIGEEN